MLESEKFEGNASSQDHEISILLKKLKFTGEIWDFEMREQEIKERGAELPENIEELRKRCLQRNKERLENLISSARTDGYKEIKQKELDEIKKRLEEIE